jgi:effector-binding domain-containing protein
MTTEDVVLKEVGRLRIAELAATAAGYGPEHIGPVIGPMYPELFRRLEAAGVTPVGPAIAYYEPDTGEVAEAGGGGGGGGGGETVTVHAGMPVTTDPRAGHDFTVVDLPAIPSAATIVHHGPMGDVMQSLQALARWIEDNGYRPVGYHREVYLDYYPDRPDEGVTELQVAVVKG